MLINFLYYFFAILAGLGAVIILLTSHMLYAILSLVFVIICLSGLYILQGATFIAITQLIIYVSGILVLIACVLLFPKSIIENFNSKKGRFAYKVIVAGTIFIGLGLFIAYLFFSLAKKFTLQDPNITIGTIQNLGYQLLGPYGLLWEVISILLLVGLVAVVYILLPESSKQSK